MQVERPVAAGEAETLRDHLPGVQEERMLGCPGHQHPPARTEHRLSPIRVLRSGAWIAFRIALAAGVAPEAEEAVVDPQITVLGQVVGYANARRREARGAEPPSDDHW